jgi:hypothetical protein
MAATSASGKFSRISAALPARKNFHQERLLLCRQVRHHKLLILEGKVSQSLRSTSGIRPLNALLQISPGATGLGNSASVWHFSIWRKRILSTYSSDHASMQRDFSA